MDENYSPQARNYSLIGSIMGACILILLGLIIFPALLPERSHGDYGGCQANLRKIGNSLKMYLADWEETYPTNRPYLKNGKLGPVSSYVKLSEIRAKADGEPYRFQRGVNWVEGLYNYMEPIAERKGIYSVWKCPQSNSSAKTTSAEVSYAFNRNLIEQPEKRIQSGSTMLMVSEVSGLLDAELRPSNKSNQNPNSVPQSTFCSAKIHGAGSFILFADGHLKLFSASQVFSKGCEWDSTTKSWYCKAAKNSPGYHAIQITP